MLELIDWIWSALSFSRLLVSVLICLSFNYFVTWSLNYIRKNSIGGLNYTRNYGSAYLTIAYRMFKKYTFGFIQKCKILNLVKSYKCSQNARSSYIGESPYQNLEETSFFSNLFYCWAFPMILKFNSNEKVKIPSNLKEDDSEKLGDQLRSVRWIKEVSEALKETGKTPSFQTALVNVFGRSVLLIGILAFIKDSILKTLQGLLLGLLLRSSISGKEAKKSIHIDQLKISLLLVFVSGIYIILHHKYTFMAKHIGMKMRIGTSSLIYRKSLKITQSALDKSGIGQVSNLLANDVLRFDNTIEYLNYIWLGPVGIIMTTGVICYYAGYTPLVGVALLLLIMPFQGKFAKLIGKLRGKVAAATDIRLKLISEIIDGILLIKMSTYEDTFIETLIEARNKEITLIRCKAILQSVMQSILIVTTRLTLLITLIACVFTGHVLDSEKVFVLLTFYNNISQTCTHLYPSGLANRAELSSAIRRIQVFLLLEENGSDELILENNETLTPKTEICNVSAKWESDFTTNGTIRNISFDLPEKRFIALTGAVGAGKAILGEVPIIRGFVKKIGKIAYTPQNPWIFPGTIRENILLDTYFNASRYESVLDACALNRDLNQFKDRDFTLVGDTGSSLSGGQKARISLARAVYQNADVYLLDDPFGSVDNNVANQIFNNCILGLLKLKSVLLVTHQRQFLECADEILILDNGVLKVQGEHNKLASLNLIPSQNIHKGLNSTEESGNECLLKDPKISQRQVQQLPEMINKGGVGLGLFLSYLKIGNGSFLVVTLMLVYLISQIVMSSCDLLLRSWLESKEVNSTKLSTGGWESRRFSLYTLSYFTGALLVVLFVRTITHYLLCLQSSVKLHLQIVNAIMHAPIMFFEENSSGRIMNLLAKDFGTIDETLPRTLFILLELFLLTTGSLLLVTLMNYYLIIPSILIIVGFIVLRRICMKASSEISRLEATTKSPVFSKLSATLRGLSTIRAFRMEANLQKIFDKTQNTHSSVFYMSIGMTRWLAMTLQLLGFAYFTIVTLSFLFLSTDPSRIGLAVSAALNISTLLAYLVSFSAELENQLVSVERAQEYTNITKENQTLLEGSPLPKIWPSSGGIKFDNVSVNYGKNFNALHKVSFAIEPQEKIGIVGRTGAGKTSLINTLFRIVNPSSGSIHIDGILIDQVCLRTLRSSISIISQNPQLFTGSLRKNLDPSNQFSETQIWKSLSQVHLEDKIRKNLQGGLDIEIRANGFIFSHGERQLLCLARAILKQAKILILDEATAHVDPKTERLIQQTLKKRFSNCTVISIAHRLITVAESDRIMVLDSGKIVEFDTPYVLLQNPNSEFYKLVQQLGPKMQAKLFKISHSISKVLKQK